MNTKFYTYEEWLNINEISDEERYEECDVCYGEGEHECECGDIHDCHECNGTGKIDIAIEEYNSIKKLQQDRLRNWLTSEVLS